MTPIEIIVGIVFPSLIMLTATVLFVIEVRICIKHCETALKNKPTDKEDEDQ